jgi:hypothetical protein
VARIAPTPDFRYVWLQPERGSFALAATAVGTGLAALGGFLWTTGHHAATSGVLAGGAALTLGALLRGLRGAGQRRRDGSARAPLAIVPWGVVVDPDGGAPRVLRWAGIHHVSVEVTHTRRGGAPLVVATRVALYTAREVLVGQISGSADLEGLPENVEAYAEEAARPVALDLEGNQAAGDGATEPVVGELLARAHEICTTARGALELGLPPRGYRAVTALVAGPETEALLASILGGAAPGPADARPLAAAVAGRLGARRLVPSLLHLVSSPHPVVAAVAKAAAIRLGAGRNRAGSIAEVASFLFEEDVTHLERWAEAAE